MRAEAPSQRPFFLFQLTQHIARLKFGVVLVHTARHSFAEELDMNIVLFDLLVNERFAHFSWTIHLLASDDNNPERAHHSRREEHPRETRVFRGATPRVRQE